MIVRFPSRIAAVKTAFLSLMLALMPTGSVPAQTPGGPGNEYDGVVVATPSPTEAPEGGAVTLRVETGAALRPFARELFGFNYDWACTGGVLLDPVTKQIDPEAARLLEGIPFPLNRMAGSDSQKFHWKGAIGPLPERAQQALWPFLPKAIVPVGPVEWVQWVREQDARARFVWVPNLGESPAEVKELAEFLVGKASAQGGKWPALRAGLGLAEPVDVAIWEIGNEMDWGAHSWTVKQYLEKAEAAIAAIRSVDPDAKIALHATTAPWVANRREPWFLWHCEVLRRLGSRIDYIAFHPYYCGLPLGEIETYLDRIRDDIVRITGEDRIRVLLSEHARWPAGEFVSANWPQTHSLDGCLATAQFLIRCLHRPEIAAATYHVFSSSYFPVSNGPWSLIYRDQKTGKLYLTGIAQMFRLFGEISGGEVLRTSLSGPGTEVSREGFSFTAAVIRGEEGLSVLVANRGPARTLGVELKGSWQMVSRSFLAGPDRAAFNTASQTPLTLTRETLAAPLPEALEIPAWSLHLIQLRELPPSTAPSL